MPIHFWIWFLFVVLTIGGWFGWRAAPALQPFGWAGGLLWLLGLAICWAVAGDPVHALIK